MIAYLSGRLLQKTPQSIVVDAGGIGYEAIVPLSTFYALPEQGEAVSLHIYTHVREDAILLFGFHEPIEKQVFTMLISVSGIGPRLAVNVLSGIGPKELVSAILSRDTKRLQAVPGVGRKTAERMALELRDAAGKLEFPASAPATPRTEAASDPLLEDAVSALVNLGYSARHARAAATKARAGAREMRLETLIRESLNTLA